MSTMLKEVYDALKEAGASEEKASAAAVAVAAYHLDRERLATKEDITGLGKATKEDIAGLEKATKEDIAGLEKATKEDIAGLKQDIAGLKQDIIRLETDMVWLKRLAWAILRAAVVQLLKSFGVI
jgi:hypothetical protein